MDSLGDYFKEAREAQGLTIEQVAVSTRIQEAYIQALEGEQFHLLPEKVFTKGFVRTYARTLGLDEQEALSRFSAAAGNYYQKEEEEQQQVLQREEDTRKGKANRNAVVILTGVILIGLLFILPREQSTPPSLAPSKVKKSEPQPETMMSPMAAKEATPPETMDEPGRKAQPQTTPPPKVEEPPPPVTPVPKPEAASRVSPQPPPQPNVTEEPTPMTPVEPTRRMATPFEPGGEQDGPLMLELEALEITWVVVRSDDRPPHEALLQPGERALWRAHERFLLTLGNAGGVKVMLNGEPRGPFGKHGTVIRDLEIKP